MTKFLAARSYQNTVGLAIERGDYYSLWAEDIKSIEGTHGSGVGTYFRFLRFLLGINVLTGFIRYQLCSMHVTKTLSNLDNFHNQHLLHIRSRTFRAILREWDTGRGSVR